MSGKDGLSPASAFELSQNFQRMNFLLQRLFMALSKREVRNPGVEGPGQPFLLRAAMGHAAGMMTNPMKAFTTHLQFWQNTTALYAELTQSMLSGARPGATPEAKEDARFSGEEWTQHPFFYYLRRQYQIMSAYLESLAETADLGEDHKHMEQIQFFTRQVVDMFSPSNFLALNPVAIRKAIDTNGRSLVEGLENFVADLERSHGDLLVTLSDPGAFKVGETLAVTPGEVIHRTDLYEIIRYHPVTEKVHARPLLLIPPWINRYYILDLQPKSSLVKWLVEQGFAVHIVSWRNPPAEMRDTGLDRYIFEGVLDAIAETNRLCESDDLNVVGYCIGGTALAMAMAWQSRQKGPSPVRSATFFTALTDFEDPGAVRAFLDESFMAGIIMDAQNRGYMDHRILAKTFSYLRPNDLVYGPAVHAYLLGEPRPKFDLLFWNQDAVRLPARMAGEYLSQLYRDNEFSRGVFDLRGMQISVADVNVPHYVVACEKDHIAPWRSSFKGLAQASGEARFVLAQSGHIAGIVNHPEKKKYGYWTSAAIPEDLDAWKSAAEARDGSWWPDWAVWLSRRSGRKVDVETAMPRVENPIGPAPGAYVLET